jgi:hypothetical protein
MIRLPPKYGNCGAYCTGGGEVTTCTFPGVWHTLLSALR